MARLQSLRLANFKSIGPEVQEIDFAPITLLFGPNSVGKSTVLQSLVFAREVILHGNLDPDTTDLGGNWLDLGGFQNLVHGRNLDTPIKLGFTLANFKHDLPGYVTEHETESLEEFELFQLDSLFDHVELMDIDIQIRWSEDRGRPYVSEYRSSLDGELIAVVRSTSDGRQVYIDEMPLLPHVFQDPLDFLDDERNLAEILADSLSQSLVTRADGVISDVASGDRPYLSFKTEELEELLEEGEAPRLEVLEKLREELGHRSTRRAASLAERVRELIEHAPNVSSVGQVAINLLRQDDALPLFNSGLVFDDDAWSSPYQEDALEESYERAIRLLLRRSLDKAICGPLSCVSTLLEKMTYVGPLRDLPPRQIVAPRTKGSPRWAKGLAAWESLPDLEEENIDEINFWLGESCLSTGYQIKVERYRELPNDHEIYQNLEPSDPDSNEIIRKLLAELPEKTHVTLQDSENGLSVMPQDIGVGISQLFPVVAASVLLKDSLITVEQPELHIHPKLQTEMADLFIRYTLSARNQFLLETHSEHLMLRLLRRVRESRAKADRGENSPGILGLVERIKRSEEPLGGSTNSFETQVLPEDLSVHYVETTPKGTKFNRLRVSEDGDFLDEWPEGFFDERDEELF